MDYTKRLEQAERVSFAAEEQPVEELNLDQETNSKGKELEKVPKKETEPATTKVSNSSIIRIVSPETSAEPSLENISPEISSYDEYEKQKEELNEAKSEQKVEEFKSMYFQRMQDDTLALAEFLYTMKELTPLLEVPKRFNTYPELIIIAEKEFLNDDLLHQRALKRARTILSELTEVQSPEPPTTTGTYSYQKETKEKPKELIKPTEATKPKKTAPSQPESTRPPETTKAKPKETEP
ncbi:hypothetical protein J6S37_00275 [Candidatus Saccharibacteria bacterium]|nr:hypothetical protein [Candidatus Saccharibacteria bacterium]